MATQVLELFINLILDGLEHFFNTILYPSKKYIGNAIFISLGFFIFSVIGFVAGFVVFVDWYEALTATLILGIIYTASSISKSQVDGFIKSAKATGKKLKRK